MYQLLVIQSFYKRIHAFSFQKTIKLCKTDFSVNKKINLSWVPSANFAKKHPSLRSGCFESKIGLGNLGKVKFP